MDVLLISNEDVCRSRMAQEILASFGRGIKISTAGLVDGKMVPDIVVEVMRENGYDVSRRKSVPVSEFVSQSWGAVITLCKEAAEELPHLGLNADFTASLDFDDPFAQSGADETFLRNKLNEVCRAMSHDLFELYRDELSERLLPRCSCGANTYCRCE